MKRYLESRCILSESAVFFRIQLCTKFSALWLVPGRNEKRALDYVLVKTWMLLLFLLLLSVLDACLNDKNTKHYFFSRSTLFSSFLAVGTLHTRFTYDPLRAYVPMYVCTHNGSLFNVLGTQYDANDVTSQVRYLSKKRSRLDIRIIFYTDF